MLRLASYALTLASVLLVTSGGSVAQGMGPPQTIPAEFAEFLEYEFDSVPARGVSANVSRSICREVKLHKSTKPDVVAKLFVCEVDLGCDATGEVPVWVLTDGTLAFFPDSPEEVVFYACPDSILDSGRRAEIEKKLKLPAPVLRKVE